MASEGYYIKRFGKKVKGNLNSFEFINEIYNQIHVEAQYTRALYRKTVSTWNTRPDFYINIKGYTRDEPVAIGEETFKDMLKNFNQWTESSDEQKLLQQERADMIAGSSNLSKYETVMGFANRIAGSVKNTLSFYIYTDSDIYRFVDGGTEVRFALMSKDWESKTSPGKLSPVLGAGNVELYGDGYIKVFGQDNPRPGITPRMFSDIIYNAEIGLFRKNLANASRRGTRKLAKSLGAGESINKYIKSGKV
jgi:hypothetical protein